jgi:hypothetical protein
VQKRTDDPILSPGNTNSPLASAMPAQLEPLHTRGRPNRLKLNNIQKTSNCAAHVRVV